MNIEQFIYTALSNNTAIAAIVGTRITPMMRHESGSAITYQHIDEIPDHDVSGSMGFRSARYQVNCWTDDYDDTSVLAALVVSALDGFTGAGIENIFLIDQGDIASIEVDNENIQQYGKRIEFEIYYKQA